MCRQTIEYFWQYSVCWRLEKVSLLIFWATKAVKTEKNLNKKLYRTQEVAEVAFLLCSWCPTLLLTTTGNQLWRRKQLKVAFAKTTYAMMKTWRFKIKYVAILDLMPTTWDRSKKDCSYTLCHHLKHLEVRERYILWGLGKRTAVQRKFDCTKTADVACVCLLWSHYNVVKGA